MKRTMFQLYLENCDEAILFYEKAFQATTDVIYRFPDSGAIHHAEITAFGQCLAFSERNSESISGNTMQFCFHFGNDHEKLIQSAYDVLKEGAQINFPLGPCDFSPAMFSLVDKFGVNWCLFV